MQALLNYGKHRCQSYFTQVEEYHKEVQHIALQFIKAIVSFWLAKARFKKSTVQHESSYLQEWPRHPAWAGKDHGTIAIAMEAACATRIRSLAVLLGGETISAFAMTR